LERRGYSAVYAANGEEALGNESLAECDAAVIDLNMPGMNGLALLERLRETAPDLPVIVLTGYGSIDTAIDAIKLGAFHYLTKPCDISHLEIYLKKAVEQSGVQRENRRLRRAIQCAEASHGIVGQSAPIRRLLDLINRLKDADAPVLITGESGTGKELVARALHERSPRRKKAFVAVNCAAFPETLIEAELFGHERGAFTGAVKRRDGRFKAADGGTLLLDEVAEIPLPAQAKLLRVLQQGMVEPLGTNDSVPVDVRVISATHRSLKEWIGEGRFREDLYYRVNVLDISIPPLRERRGDLPLLLEHFLRQHTPAGQPIPRISPRAWAALSEYAFPGNVRELSHAIEHAIVLSRGREIDLDHLPRDIGGSARYAQRDEASIRPLTVAMKEFEREYLVRTLALARNNRTRAADVLGISRKTLWEKLRFHGLSDAETDEA